MNKSSITELFLLSSSSHTDLAKFSSLCFESISFTGGLPFTLFRSSCKQLSKNERNSSVSCCSNPEGVTHHRTLALPFHLLSTRDTSVLKVPGVISFSSPEFNHKSFIISENSNATYDSSVWAIPKHYQNSTKHPKVHLKTFETPKQKLKNYSLESATCSFFMNFYTPNLISGVPQPRSDTYFPLSNFALSVQSIFVRSREEVVREGRRVRNTLYRSIEIARIPQIR